MDQKEFKLRSEAVAGGVELMTGIMLMAVEMVEKELGTQDDVMRAGEHLGLCAQIAKLIAHDMIDRNDVDTRKKFLEHTVETVKELVGKVFDIKDEINKEIIARNEFSKAEPSSVAESIIAKMQQAAKDKAAGKQPATPPDQPLQPGPEKPADPPAPGADPGAGGTDKKEG